jgi:hypothetical protein
MSVSMRGCTNEAMVKLLGHRQTKGAETDKLDLTRLRHTSTPPCQALGAACGNRQTVILSMDQTDLGDQFAVLMVSPWGR